MIINCPSCSARFRVAARTLGGEGRSVRCSRCSYVWHQAPLPEEEPAEAPAAAASVVLPPVEEARPEEVPAEDPGYPPPPLPREIPPRALPEPEAPPRKGGWLLGWLLLLLVAAALVGGGWYGRDRLVEAVPELRKAYDWLGVPLTEAPPVTPALEPLAIAGVESRVEAGRLTVTGEIVNRGAVEIAPPPLRARVRAPSGQQLLSWTFPAAAGSLAPGATARFESAQTLPPGTDPEAIEVQVELVAE